MKHLILVAKVQTKPSDVFLSTVLLLYSFGENGWLVRFVCITGSGMGDRVRLPTQYTESLLLYWAQYHHLGQQVKGQKPGMCQVS